MIPMTNGAELVREMTENLPLYCYSNKRNTKALAEQGLKLSEKTKLEVVGVRDFFDAGGVMCDIKHEKSGQVLIMSLTGLDFKGNGDIDERISTYKKARIEWLKQEEMRDMIQNLPMRTKATWVSSEPQPLKISRNTFCPCGSDKKYKHCCGK